MRPQMKENRGAEVNTHKTSIRSIGNLQSSLLRSASPHLGRAGDREDDWLPAGGHPPGEEKEAPALSTPQNSGRCLPAGTPRWSRRRCPPAGGHTAEQQKVPACRLKAALPPAPQALPPAAQLLLRARTPALAAGGAGTRRRRAEVRRRQARCGAETAALAGTAGHCCAGGHCRALLRCPPAGRSPCTVHGSGASARRAVPPLPLPKIAPAAPIGCGRPDVTKLPNFWSGGRPKVWGSRWRRRREMRLPQLRCVHFPRPASGFPGGNVQAPPAGVARTAPIWQPLRLLASLHAPSTPWRRDGPAHPPRRRAQRAPPSRCPQTPHLGGAIPCFQLWKPIRFKGPGTLTNNSTLSRTASWEQ